MNVVNIVNSKKLYNLYDQIFDYFSLAIYDLESKIDTSFEYKNIKNKLETFADKHFKSALNDFNREILKLKDQIPEDFGTGPGIMKSGLADITLENRKELKETLIKLANIILKKEKLKKPNLDEAHEDQEDFNKTASTAS